MCNTNSILSSTGLSLTPDFSRVVASAPSPSAALAAFATREAVKTAQTVADGRYTGLKPGANERSLRGGCALFALVLLASALSAFAAEDGFKPLFNGQDLKGWDGNPELWKVENGTIVGTTTGPDHLAYNQFLIWRGGTVKNFELRAKVKQAGNNSGIQYRSKELPEVGKWSIGGYQCDIHPTAENNAMLYDERGRGIIAKNGQSVIIAPNGDKFLTAERAPVKVEVAEWNEYSVIAQGNKLTHKVNGQVTAEIIDHQVGERELEGLLALQIHRGPAMRVEIKDVMLKVLPDGGLLSPEQAPVPADAKKIEAPKAAGKKAAPKKKAN
jgi:hypothetical protein